MLFKIRKTILGSLSCSVAFIDRLPSDVLEKMPSASNSPMTPRRRRSRISTLAQSLQQKRSIVAAAAGTNSEDAAEAEAATADDAQHFEKSPSPVMEKFRQQERFLMLPLVMLSPFEQLFE